MVNVTGETSDKRVEGIEKVEREKGRKVESNWKGEVEKKLGSENCVGILG